MEGAKVLILLTIMALCHVIRNYVVGFEMNAREPCAARMSAPRAPRQGMTLRHPLPPPSVASRRAAGPENSRAHVPPGGYPLTHTGLFQLQEKGRLPNLARPAGAVS